MDIVAQNEYEDQEDVSQHYTDMGNAARLVSRHGDKLRYVPQWGWLVWDGKKWAIDENTVMHYAKQTVLAMYQEASATQNDNLRQQLLDHARHSESHYRLEAMVKLAQSERKVVASVDDFDTNPFLLTVGNGTIDLSTGELKPHNPQDMITKHSTIEYHPDACSEIWESFLDDITCKDQELKDYLQQIIGYSLTGSTREECFFIAYGSGRNGKSKLLEAVQNVMGEYAKETASKTFMRKEGNSGPTNDLAYLNGARLVTTVETESGKSLDVPTVKQITGGDRITARFLHKEFFTFKPQMKLFMATNNRPEVGEDSVAIWSRIKLIPFRAYFSEDKQDKQLGEKLKAAGPAILAWAVKGCLMWQQSGGLIEPKIVKEATADYRDDQDILADFIAEKCEKASNEKIKARELYKAYEGWCHVEDVKPVSETTFGERMIAKGYKRTKINGTRHYHNICLKNPRSNLQPLPRTTPVTDEELAEKW